MQGVWSQEDEIEQAVGATLLVYIPDLILRMFWPASEMHGPSMRQASVATEVVRERLDRPTLRWPAGRALVEHPST